MKPVTQRPGVATNSGMKGAKSSAPQSVIFSQQQQPRSVVVFLGAYSVSFDFIKCEQYY